MDRLVVTRAEALHPRGGEHSERSPQQCQTTVVLSTDADVIMFVNLCDNARGKSKNTLNNAPRLQAKFSLISSITQISRSDNINISKQSPTISHRKWASPKQPTPRKPPHRPPQNRPLSPNFPRKPSDSPPNSSTSPAPATHLPFPNISPPASPPTSRTTKATHYSC